MALGELSSTWAQLGDHEKAYAYRLRYEALSDTIFNEEKTRSLVRQQMNYGFAQRQLADSLATKERSTWRNGTMRSNSQQNGTAATS
ncbi:MAG: hypothetical protein IPK99_11555 [Flavobacteriales bacterium]|nr:hypothetical protein [Flavobacteriales bacterium]